MSPVAPFPAQPPASLTDQDAIAANDWAAFSDLTMLADHWARPAWPDGAEAVYWIVDLGDQLELRALAADYQAALAADSDLSPVPVGLLHLTMHRVPVPVDTPDSELLAVAGAAADRLCTHRPIALCAGPLAGSPGAVRFTVSPWRDLLGVQAALAVGDPPRDRRPHISIAYNGRVRPATPVVDAVRRLRDGRTAVVDIDRVDLVRLRRAGRTYRWSLIVSVPLGR
jgi:hypothetical protein